MKKLSVISGVQLLFTFLATFNLIQGQIIISSGPEVTPVDMVEKILGEGVLYDYVTYQGADIASGIFSNGDSTNLGLSSGVFLTSGSGEHIPGPNNSSSAGTNNGLGGHPSLNAISTYTTYDASVLEFDVLLEIDTLKFTYVFGSEEYNLITTSDVMGFFITGPNPMGGYYNDQNIAVVPGTTLPVNCFNINSSTNSQYYIDNTGGLTLQYDGFTVVLTAWVLVNPCETYHIKLGIADAGDHIYDSGVFIAENSIVVPDIEVEIVLDPPGISNHVVEGCVEADITFRLPGPEYSPVIIDLDIGGTAINGSDYEVIPNAIVFEEGMDSVSFHINAYHDGILENEETIELIIENTLGCIVRYDTVVITILDYVDMITEISPNTMICSGQEVDLWVNIYNGFPPYTYLWEPGFFTTDTITVSPEETTIYTVTFYDVCQESDSASTTVTVLPDYLNDINSFSFEAENNPFLEDDVMGQISGDSVYLFLPFGTGLENLIATFNISNCATAYVNGNVQISGVTVIDFTNPVTYQVVAQNGDEKNWIVVVDLMTGHLENRVNNISIFPNPVKNNIYINDAKGYELSIINSLGVKLFHEKINTSHFSVDVCNFEEGIYYLQFTREQQWFVEKVIINR